MPWLAVAFVLLLGFAARGNAAESETNRFVVLELKVTATEVSVVGATEVAGRSKPQPARSGVDFEIRTQDNVVLHSGQVANPRLQQFCIEASPGSGQMTNLTATLDEAYVTVRVPANSSAASIEFYESRRPGASPLSPRRSLGKTAFVHQ